MKTFILLLIAASLVFTASCAAGEPAQSQPGPEPGVDNLLISLDYNKQSGWASNQFALWIEDAHGNHVRTLYATKYTAGGGYKKRGALPLWVSKSGAADMSKAEVDAVSGATPKPAGYSYIWNRTDSEGNLVPEGEYTFYIEGSLRWSNRVVYSGTFRTGEYGEVEVTAEYIYEADEDHDELTADSEENNMIINVAASFNEGS